MRAWRVGFVAMFGSAWLAAGATAAEPSVQGVADVPMTALPLAQIAVHESPAVDTDLLRTEDAWRAEQGLPFRYALPEAVQLTPSNSGTWEVLPSGTELWRLRISSPGALSLNLGFGRFLLTAGSRLQLRGTAAGDPVLSYEASDVAPHGELWTPVVLGDDLVIELHIGPGSRSRIELELSAIGRGYRLFGEAAKAGACNVDVVCPEGDAWRNEIDAVGLLSLNGSLVCTGCLLNNTGNDGRPLFLTAFHCGVSAPLASTVVVYWNFQSPGCGDQGGGVLNQTSSGSNLLATWSDSDFTLVELDSPPSPTYGAKYAGWDRSGAVPSAAVGIHHPDSDEKSISFENDPLEISSYLIFTSPGNGTHWRVNDWDLGTTEPGSSGSPLFDQDHRVVGQLHGGWAACGNDDPDWYGRLVNSWTGGGTSTTRLSDWLDPASSGALRWDLFDPSAGGFIVTPSSGLTANGPQGGPFAPSVATFTLDNAGDQPATFATTVNAGWVDVDPVSGVVPPASQATVTVAIAAAAASLPVGRHTAEVTITNTALGSGTTTRTVDLVVVSLEPVIAAIVPNPFGESTEIRYTLAAPAAVTWRVLDLRGRLLRGPVTSTGVSGENALAWDGRDGAGHRLPSGVYVVELRANGATRRATVVLTR